MDPLSIAANVVGITAFCAKLTQDISRFVIDVREVPDTLARFYNTIQNLQTALLGIERAFRQRPEQLPFERDHHQNISQIIQSCRSALGRLNTLLPDLREDGGAYDRIRANLIISVKKNTVQQCATHIESYTQVLQLSLTTLSLGSLWKTQRSQEQIYAAIRSLTDSIRSANLLPPPNANGVSGSAATALETATGENKAALTTPQAGVGSAEEDGPTTSLADEITAWQKSATEMAEVLSLYEPDQMPRILDRGGGGISRHLPSDSGIGGMFDYGSGDEGDRDNESDNDDGNDKNDENEMAAATAFDPEPDHPDCPSREIIQFNFEQNQKIVTQLVRCGIFTKAALYQRKAIGYRAQLAEAYQVPFPYDEQADMREFLAEVLIDSETRAGCVESREILQMLLKAEVSRPPDEVDQQRRCRLYHKLGKLYLDQGNTSQARRFLGRAFEGRKDTEAMPQELVLESVDQLIKALQLEQAFDEARGYLEWRRQHIPASLLLLPPPPRKLSAALPDFLSSSSSPSPPPSSRPSISGASLPPPVTVVDPTTTSTALEDATMLATDSAAAPLAGALEHHAEQVAPLSCIGSGISPKATVADVVFAAAPVAAPGAAGGGAAGLSNAFAWCIEKHFDVDDPSFRFEVYDSGQNTSPLHLALQEENIELVRQMINHAVDLEHRDSKFCTPLLVAAGTRNRETTRLLLERGAKVDVRDMNSLSALHRCQGRSGGVQVAKLLLQYLPLPVPQSREQFAAGSSYPTVAPAAPAAPAALAAPQSLSRGGAKPHIIDDGDANGRTAFFMAMDNGNDKMARFLLSEGANPDITDVFGKTALYMACERGDEFMARLALDHGAHVDARGPGLRTPLIAAIETAVPTVAKCALIKILLEHGADPRVPDADGRTAFAASRTTSFSSEIKWLLQQHQQQRPRSVFTDAVVATASDAGGVLGKHSSHSSRSSSFASRRSRRLL